MGADAPKPAFAKPVVVSKPAFTPTHSSGGGFIPQNRSRQTAPQGKVDGDGWGEDAPEVTRTQLEKVKPAYQPTKVDMRSLSSQPQAPAQSAPEDDSRPGVIRGAYQPVGKVDIAAIRRQAKESGSLKDDRPETIKGSYEPVGKVDIAAIRAKAQKPGETGSSGFSRPPPASEDAEEPSRPISERSAAFNTSERLTSMPKPKVANKFGGASSFTGTKAPLPGAYGGGSSPAPPTVGSASRTFAEQGGKTPAQIWAEKKAKERGSGAAEPLTSSYSGQSPVQAQTSGGGEWKSGYTGKSWAPVQTSHTGKSGGSIGQQNTGDAEPAQAEAAGPPTGGIGSLRDRFSGSQPMGAPATNFDRSAPEPDTSNKPNRGIPIPGLSQPSMPEPPPQPPRSPTPPTPVDSGSPIRVAAPIARGATPTIADAREEQVSPPPAMPIRSLEKTTTQTYDNEPDEPEVGPDPARAQAQTTAAAAFGHEAVAAAPAAVGGKRALAQYDYEAAGRAPFPFLFLFPSPPLTSKTNPLPEDNEISFAEGEHVRNIDMVDEDWWMGENARGDTGLFPANYVELVEGGADDAAAAPAPAPVAAASAPAPAAAVEAPGKAAGQGAVAKGPTATALYDYEAAEDNEISFPEGAKIYNLVSNLPFSLTRQLVIVRGFVELY